MLNDFINRPPVGFIVEGDGEYNCYRSLFCRIVDVDCLLVPIVNAGGCGSLIMRLDEQLDDLMTTDDPVSVIITVDLEDAIRQKLAADFNDLVTKLDTAVKDWEVKAQNNRRIKSLPKQIICVPQVRKFESWMLSDLKSLENAGLLKDNTVTVSNAEDIENPSEWIEKNVIISGSVKKPKIAKQVISILDPHTMILHSQSFKKFYQESINAYSNWQNMITVTTKYT